MALRVCKNLKQAAVEINGISSKLIGAGGKEEIVLAWKVFAILQTFMSLDPVKKL